MLLQEELDNATNFLKITDTDEHWINENENCPSKLSYVPRNVKLSVPSSLSKIEDWCILDCVFGVPLFDTKLNFSICNAIVQDGLWLLERYFFNIYYQRIF